MTVHVGMQEPELVYAYKGQIDALHEKIERLTATLKGITEFCSGDDRTLGAIARLAHIRNTADQALRAFT